MAQKGFMPRPHRPRRHANAPTRFNSTMQSSSTAGIESDQVPRTAHRQGDRQRTGAVLTSG
jgi:hypothetical protein